MNKEKIKTQKEIIKLVLNLKKQGKRIVTYNGAFDILQPGHIDSLREAKEQGDVLIVLLNSDKSVKGYKGSNRPINSQRDRAKLLSSLEMISYILIFDELIPNEILAKIKPNIHCVGADWGKGCIERKIVEENGGKIHILMKKNTISTSKIIRKIFKNYQRLSLKAIFLDRDGVINKNKPEYIHRIKDFKFKKGVIGGLKKLSKTEFKIIVVTNQSGIARGYFSEKDLKKSHNWMLNNLKNKGIRIDKIYYCPHHPDFGNKKYRKKCNCRKPNPGLIQKAVKYFDISLNDSWLIGDDIRDILMGRRINLKTIFLGANKKSDFNKLGTSPDYFVKNFSEAVNIILEK